MTAYLVRYGARENGLSYLNVRPVRENHYSALSVYPVALKPLPDLFFLLNPNPPTVLKLHWFFSSPSPQNFCFPSQFLCSTYILFCCWMRYCWETSACSGIINHLVPWFCFSKTRELKFWLHSVIFWFWKLLALFLISGQLLIVAHAKL